QPKRPGARPAARRPATHQRDASLPARCPDLLRDEQQVGESRLADLVQFGLKTCPQVVVRRLAAGLGTAPRQRVSHNVGELLVELVLNWLQAEQSGRTITFVWRRKLDERQAKLTAARDFERVLDRSRKLIAE